jgi:parvulin-like peptidyl-prolyl isomerase
MSAPPPAAARAHWLLAAGAALGLALAAASLLAGAGGGRGLPEGAAASVNGAVIRSEELERLLAALASDRRSPLGPEDRRHVLDRLIEEELLVQHGVELGLLRSDRRVRADLVSAVLAFLDAAADAFEPTPREVAEFYAQNAAYFATPGRLRVRPLWVPAAETPDAAALARAREAVARLRAGEPFAAVSEALGDAGVAPLPDTLLPPAKLREYLGPSALAAALELAPGAVSEPVRTPQGYYVLLLAERTPDESPPLAEVEPEVRAELRRRAGDRLLRERLDALRAQADVSVAEGLP